MSPSPTPRMPRAQRRSQLLELATRVFTEKGFQGTSMDDIASAAGVTKPVLYQHFSSKETLYVEVIDIIAERMLGEVREIGSFEGDTPQRVRHGLERFYQLVSLENALRLFTGHESVSEAVQKRVDAVLDKMAIELSGVLAASRQMSSDQARIIGRGLIADTQTTARLLHEAGGDAEREEVLEVMTTFMVHGLTGFAPRRRPRVAGTVLGADGTARPGSDG
ncbi:TetR/AcrR family transcriptional regulator [Brachybacterium sacelli]|uniref:AcrR family transcriptional regulator n=1 Tax=Brachybacterium sacelli TaxID=173364 RepID=A0ABS4X1H4_9MICO|nr:TetR/AcrR family transcriptional regulator [Brachybacterium sacelli]MBP2382248.1 AcrR family transcriptional regulator [Brachybacterium sacelli]